MKFPLTGFSGTVHLKGTLDHCICPVCTIKVSISIVEMGLTPRIHHVPTVNLRKNTVAICHHCNGKFSPSKKVLHCLVHSPHTILGYEHFTSYESPKKILDI